ncbi:SRPBCC family protein [Pendulispora rubella]|uniref:SRPBCC family protein n=1 Tax=Pendulispora rubella TaxID=2741070 RepID=A0ABZ2KYI7_9BACT
MTIDTTLDLVLERMVDVPPELVWMAWTQPEHVKKWFTPAPWTTIECEIDLRPGGLFRTVMSSPEGEKHPNFGCYLDIVPNRRLVWTDALEAGFRPSRHTAHLGFRFTAAILLEPHGAGTKYVAHVMHSDKEYRDKHETMGFFDGWGTATDQLMAHARTLRV